jgi:hypothetical protein
MTFAFVTCCLLSATSEMIRRPPQNEQIPFQGQIRKLRLQAGKGLLRVPQPARASVVGSPSLQRPITDISEYLQRVGKGYPMPVLGHPALPFTYVHQTLSTKTFRMAGACPLAPFQGGRQSWAPKESPGRQSGFFITVAALPSSAMVQSLAQPLPWPRGSSGATVD